jgi:hypothetical protein
MFAARMFRHFLRRVGSFASLAGDAITTSIASFLNTADQANRHQWKRGDPVLTWRAPGLIGQAKIEATITLRGDEHYIVVFRETPDVIFGLRDAGALWGINDGAPKNVTAGSMLK